MKKKYLVSKDGCKLYELNHFVKFCPTFYGPVLSIKGQDVDLEFTAIVMYHNRELENCHDNALLVQQQFMASFLQHFMYEGAPQDSAVYIDEQQILDNFRARLQELNILNPL